MKQFLKIGDTIIVRLPEIHNLWDKPIKATVKEIGNDTIKVETPDGDVFEVFPDEIEEVDGLTVDEFEEEIEDTIEDEMFEFYEDEQNEVDEDYDYYDEEFEPDY